ncbi:MAG: RNA polymerase factor sigma-54 [Tepidisphaeraceae bacterium]
MGQHQVLTPRMIQSMEILQLPLMALEERIDQELQVNPVLDQKIDREKPSLDEGFEAPGTDNRTLSIDGDTAAGAEFDRLSKIADYLENEEYSPGYRPTVAGGGGDRDKKMDALANTAARGGALADHLIEQWNLTDIPPDLDKPGRWIIAHLDADGYLRTPMADLVQTAAFPADLPRFEKALKLVQTLEPAGVGARDLSECMVLQLNALEEDEELSEGHDFDLERALVRDHLEDLRLNRYPQLSKKLGYSIDELKAAVRRLARLSPHPGRAFGPSEAPSITPDATVYKDEETGKYEVKMRSDPSENLYIRKRYRQMLQDKSVDKKTRDFVMDKVRSARWLIESIQQRKSTIARVIRVVVDAQQDFFEQGPEALKPLPMIQVADQLGIHVATVSRAVAEKYIQTPIGIFPLRRFFTGGTTDSSGTSMSWDAVKEKIRKIIDEEDKDKPLSDDEIVDKVKEQGIELARRTVAKYRKILNIPTARQRRQF